MALNNILNEIQIKEISVDGLKSVYQITIPDFEIKTRFESRCLELGKTVKIPGFRPGKIPLATLISRYGKNVRTEVLESVMENAATQLVAEKKLQTILTPTVELKSYKENENLECLVTVEILPVIPDIDLKKITGDKLVTLVTDDQIEAQLEKIAANNKSTEPLKEKRPTKKGDTVVIDFVGSTQDGPIKGGSGQDFNLELGSGTFIPGFEDQLMGWSIGDKKEIRVTFPANYPEKKLADKPAVFEVTVKEILQSKKTVVDDKLSEKLGFKNLAELKLFIQQNLQAENDRMSLYSIKKSVLDQLDKTAIELPQSFIEHEYKLIEKEYLKDQQNHNHDEHVHTENCNHHSHTIEVDAEAAAALKVIAERRVRLGLILAEIGKKYKIEVTQDELDHAIWNQARRYSGQEEKAYAQLKKNEHIIQSLRAPIFEDKVINLIVKESNIKDKEVSLSELEKAVKNIIEDDKV